MHFGLYSVAARHEWVRYREKLDADTYQRYFDHFTADAFDARAWARTAKSTGMKYVVFTTKHHEGFSLWDTKQTDFSAPHSPANRDLVAEMVAACRAEGLRVGLYYSLIDWHHPDFPLDALHPDWDRAGGAESPIADGAAYVSYLHAQVAELLDLFDPDILWFDFSYGDDVAVRGKSAEFWRSTELRELVRARSPHVLINDRLGLPDADFLTPEEVQPDAASMATTPVWEACRTLNGSWGYAPDFQNWLDARQVVRTLIDSVSKGGNLLLNVGPDGRGGLEPRARDLLEEVGEWTRLHGASIYGAGASSIVAPPGCRITQNGTRVFVHVLDWPTGHLVLSELPGRLRFASFLHDNREVEFVVESAHQSVPHEQHAGPAGSTVLRLPLRQPEVAVPVIELDLEW